MKETCEPAFSDWSSLLPAAPRSTLSCGDTVIDVIGFRKKLLHAALRFQGELIETARDAGVRAAVLEAAHERGFPSDVLVACGHQPIVYHPGLIEKNLRLSRFCAAQRCTGLNIIVDTDDSDGGILRYPARLQSADVPVRLSERTGTSALPLVLKQSPLAPDDKMFLATCLHEGGSLSAALDEAAEGLRSSGRGGAAGRFEPAREAYQKLQGAPTVLAHTIVRSLYETERSYLEIPFSSLLKEEEVKSIFKAVLAKGRGFAELYNDSLHRHRDAHRIENPANPFPDLKVSPQGYELPLWVVNLEAGTRTVLQVREETGGESVIGGNERSRLFRSSCAEGRG